MSAAIITVFLPHGDAKRIRTAEISNWTGKAIAAPRIEFECLLSREELLKPGVYILIGIDPDSGDPKAYIAEAELIKDQIKTHADEDFWVQAIVFVNKEDNLTRPHVRYLANRLIEQAKDVGRVKTNNPRVGRVRLPETDRANIEAFLSHIRQLLPVLGADLFTPNKEPSSRVSCLRY